MHSAQCLVAACTIMGIVTGLQLAGRPAAGKGLPAQSSRERSPVPASAGRIEGPKDCGRKAAYLLLRMTGHAVSYGDVCRVLPTTDRGASMLAVVRTLEALGQPAMAVHVRPTAIRRLPLPAILLVHGRGGLGHYVVLVRMQGKGKVSLIEPCSLRIFTTDGDSLSKFWDGYAIVPRSGVRWAMVAVGVALLVAGLCCLVAARLFLGRSGGPCRASTVAFFLLACSSVGGCASATTARSTPSWREIPLQEPPARVRRFSWVRLDERHVARLRSLLAVCQPSSDLRPNGFLHAARLQVTAAQAGLCEARASVTWLRALYSAYRQRSPYGVFVKTAWGVRADGFPLLPADRTPAARVEAHTGQFLLVAAEAGMTTHDQLPAGGTVADVVRHLLANFNDNDELEWIVPALATFVAPRTRWLNKYGIVCDLNQSVLRLADPTMLAATRACHATHVLYALAYVLALHRQRPFLSHEAVVAAQAQLERARVSLAEKDPSDGDWGPGWYEKPDPAQAFLAPDVLVWGITGHHLEWLSLCPSIEPISPSHLQQAADHLLATQLDRREFRILPGPWTHALRGVIVCAEVQAR